MNFDGYLVGNLKRNLRVIRPMGVTDAKWNSPIEEVQVCLDGGVSLNT